MMSFVENGFVFLATTKTGSTSIQRAFRRYASLEVRRPPKMKHMPVRAFNAAWVPVFEFHGFPRESYELLAVVRHPVDWTASWWRYRSRPELRGEPTWTGETSFEEFAEKILARELRLGGHGRFVTDETGKVAVERVYRYEHLEEMVAWMADRLGIETPTLPRTNASPSRPVTMSRSLRHRLEEHYSRDMAVYENAL